MVIKVWTKYLLIWSPAICPSHNFCLIFLFLEARKDAHLKGSHKHHPRPIFPQLCWVTQFFHLNCQKSHYQLIICAAYDVRLSQVLLMLDICHNHHKLVVYNFSLYQIVLNLFIWLPIYYQIIKSSCCQITIKKDCELIILSDYRFIKTWFAKFGLVW